MPDAMHRHAPEAEDRLAATFGFVTALVAWTGPDGQIKLASGGEDGTIRRWDATTGTEIGAPMAVGSWIDTLAVWTGRDGQIELASASGDRSGTIRRWDATTGAEIGQQLYHKTRVQALVAWTGPDGHMMLASGGRDGKIRRWEAATADTEIGEPLTVSSKWVNALVVWSAPDGRIVLASGGEDERISRWDATTGAEIGVSFTRGRMRRRGVEWVNDWFPGLARTAIRCWQAAALTVSGAGTRRPARRSGSRYTATLVFRRWSPGPARTAT